MYRKIIIFASLLLQLFASWFLLSFLIFADAHADWFEQVVYLLLSVAPYIVALTIYLRQKQIKKSILISVGLYFLSAIILTFIPLIKNFYVTGMGGVGLISISVMAIHALITFFTIYFLSRTPEQNIGLKKQLPLILLCSVFTFFLFGFFNTVARNIEPNSYLALGYLDIKETLSTLGLSIFIGFFNVFLKLVYLFAIIVYAVICFGLIYYKEKRSAQPLSFGKKLILFFIPIWIAVGVYALAHEQQIKESMAYNFANFQPVWSHRSQIRPFTVKLNNTSFVVWCEREPITNDQTVSCGNRLKVSIGDKPVGIDESVYPKELNVGMFEKIPIYSDTERACRYTKNDATINGKLFLVTTEQCNPRNFPVLAGIEWDEFIRPLLLCFGSEQCQIPQARY